jgi:hypothetical protein
VRLLDNRVGVAAQRGSHASVEESVIESTEQTTDPRAPSQGLEAQGGGTVDVSTTEMRGLAVTFASQNAGSRITIKRSVLDRREVSSSGSLFAAVIYDSTADISESVIRGRQHTLSLGHPGAAVGAQDRARLTVTSSVVVDLPTRTSDPFDPKDAAFWVNAGANLVLDNVTVRAAERRAFYAMGTGAQARLSHVLVAPLASARRGPLGVFALGGAQAELDHVVILGANGAGVVVAQAGSRATLRSSLVHGTTAADGLAFGIGAVDDATLLAEDVTVTKNGSNGVVVNAAKGELTRVLVARNYADVPEKGVGIGATRDGFVAVRDSEVVENNVAAFFFVGASGLLVNSVVSNHEFGLLRSGVTSREASVEEVPPAREVVLVDTPLSANKQAHAEATHVEPLPEPAY